MRKFSVTNAKGKTFDMMRTDAFFSVPKGLGTKLKNTYTAIGSSYINTKSALEQKKPKGTMIFRGYEQYDEFINVIKHRPITLRYEPYEGEVLYIDCDGYEISKGEIKWESNRLECSIQFLTTSTWYHALKVVKNEAEHEGKKYSYGYPYQYTESSTGVIKINNASNLDNYAKITILGPVTNPVWVLMQGEKVITTGKMNLVLKNGERLIINSDPLNLTIALYDNENQMVKDVYEQSDFSTGRFVYAPAGESILSFSHEEASEMKIWMEVKELVE